MVGRPNPGIVLEFVNRPLRVLLTGGNGQLGRDLSDVLAGGVPDGGTPAGRVAAEGGPGILPPVDGSTFEVRSTDIDTLDVADRTAVRAAVDAFRPDIVLHGGAYTAVDACESDPDTRLRRQCARHPAHGRGGPRRRGPPGLRLDRLRLRRHPRPPYVEWDRPGPRSVYGRSKLGGELEVRAVSGPSATIVRTAWVSGAHGANMVKTVLRLARSAPGGTLRFVDDQHGCPTFTADLARALVRLALDRRPGTFHVTNQGETTLVRVRPGHAVRRRPRPTAGGAHRHLRPRPAPAGAPAGQLEARQRRPAPVRAAPAARVDGRPRNAWSPRCRPTTPVRGPDGERGWLQDRGE